MLSWKKYALCSGTRELIWVFYLRGSGRSVWLLQNLISPEFAIDPCRYPVPDLPVSLKNFFVITCSMVRIGKTLVGRRFCPRDYGAYRMGIIAEGYGTIKRYPFEFCESF